MTQPLTERLRLQAQCVYLAADAGPAGDISDGLSKAADHIEALEATQAELVGMLREARGMLADYMAAAALPGGEVVPDDAAYMVKLEALFAKLESSQ